MPRQGISGKARQALILSSCGLILAAITEVDSQTNGKKEIDDIYSAAVEYHNRGEHLEAINIYKTLEEHKGLYNFYLNYGLALQSLGDSTEAIKQLDKSLEMNHSNDTAFLARGIAKINAGRHRAGCMDISKSAALGNLVSIQWIAQNNIEKCEDPRNPALAYFSSNKA